MRDRLIHPGRQYRRNDAGRFEEVPAGVAEVWICRRLEDYPRGRPPEGAGLAWCHRCGRPIAFNPETPLPASVPKACGQCYGIDPLPMD
jgi:hypothetical protein